MTQAITKPANDQPRVALFVDGENISSDHAGKIIMQSLKRGQLAVRRVYGGLKNLGKWDTRPGFRLIHTGSGKNAADMMIAIQAVAMSFENRVDVFVLVSSDGDFTLLAHHLRERGFTVVGMGEKKTPEAFRKACHDFCELTPTEAKDISPQVARVIEAHDGPISIKLLGSRMSQNHKIKISARPEKKWRTYLENHPDRFRCEGDGQEARVSLIAKD